jgi:hypothetical protein
MIASNDNGKPGMAEGTRERRSHEAGGVPAAVAEYKAILKAALDIRPSGFRRKLAAAIGRHPSFVSQITNPIYPVPIPAPHIDAIFEVCRLSPEEREAFLSAYGRAHPRRARAVAAAPTRRASRQVVLSVPDLGDAHANSLLDLAIEDLVRHLTPLLRRAGDSGSSDTGGGDDHP